MKAFDFGELTLLAAIQAMSITALPSEAARRLPA